MPQILNNKRAYLYLIFSLVFQLNTIAVAMELPAWQARGPHIKVSLLAEQQTLTAGTNWLGIYLEPEAEWHTYWRNPGDSGEAPVIDWQLPDGVSAGDIHWPVPEAIRVAHLVNYGYDGANLLMVPVEITQQYADNHTSLDVQADISWLVCKEDCIPGWATLTRRWQLADKASPSQEAPLFSHTRGKLPQPASFDALHEITDEHVVVNFPAPDGQEQNWRLFPFRSDLIQHAAEQQVLRNDQDLTAIIPLSEYYTKSEDSLTFLLSNGEQGVYVHSNYNGRPAGTASSPVPVLLTLGMAFIGGLILNLMPCVLPVLAMKALSVQHSGKPSASWAYFAGVQVSMLALATLVLFIKGAGDAVGWGFHMQEPWFVAILAYLFVFITMMLMEVAPTGSRFAGIGQQLVSGHGTGSQFFTGVLAVVVATPCTAPFMATAMGVALASETWLTLLIFLALGAGLALPLSLLFMLPALASRLPKPGSWMRTFREFLIFPMLFTVAWLIWVFVNQTDSHALLLLLGGLITFAAAIWLFSRARGALQWLAPMLIVAAIALPMRFTGGSPDSQNTSNEPFTQARLNQLLANNQVVFVNMTADWCITCKVNEQVALQSAELETLLTRSDVHYLVGDWTNKNREILAFLNQFERSGVPLYVVYAGNQRHQVLPQLLTTDIVTEAIKQAIGETQNET